MKVEFQSLSLWRLAVTPHWVSRLPDTVEKDPRPSLPARPEHGVPFAAVQMSDTARNGSSLPRPVFIHKFSLSAVAASLRVGNVFQTRTLLDSRLKAYNRLLLRFSAHVISPIRETGLTSDTSAHDTRLIDTERKLAHSALVIRCTFFISCISRMAMA